MKVVNADGKLVDIDIFFEKVPSGGGRPKKVLTEDAQKLIENMARIFCTEEEIATCLGTTPDTLLNENNKELFRTAIKRGQANGHQSLRRKQYELAMRGNVSMLVWLGKQYLGQAERQSIDVTTGDEKLNEMKTYLEFIKNGKEDI